MEITWKLLGNIGVILGNITVILELSEHDTCCGSGSGVAYECHCMHASALPHLKRRGGRYRDWSYAAITSLVLFVGKHSTD